MSFFIYNDKIYQENTPVITPDNRSLKYGEGLFETLRINSSIIELYDYHFERLISGMETLQFKNPLYFTAGYFQNKIEELCRKNSHTSFARVRLTVFRGIGDLIDLKNNLPGYIIQTWSLEKSPEPNLKGLILDIYPAARKSCDTFAKIKSNNFLPYAMAALYAKKTTVDDCIVLNQYGRICDTSIANIFIVKDRIIYTPPLSEGCIAGVMRRFITEKSRNSEFKIIEKPVSVEDVQNADEVFLTNSIRGIMWVKQFQDIKYDDQMVKQIRTFIHEELKKKN